MGLTRRRELEREKVNPVTQSQIAATVAVIAGPRLAFNVTRAHCRQALPTCASFTPQGFYRT